VLIDLREDILDETPGRGLILHHRRVDSYEEGEALPRLKVELMAKIEAVLAATERPSSARNLLLDYSDPLSPQSRRKFWGAIERVILTEPDGEPYDTGWLVLVQEPAIQ
jgi:hypothetical protein